MRTRKLHGIAALLVLAGIIAHFGAESAWAAVDPANPRGSISPPAVCDCRGGGGLPGPFDGSNLTVELSDGDLYALAGRVVFLTESPDGFAFATEPPGAMNGVRSYPYLEVDLKQHPWLANSHRKDHPYYRLLGANSFWRNLEGQSIELSTQAEGHVVIGATAATSSYEIQLLPLAVYMPHCK